MLINKKILIVSPEPWDHIFVSKHHYATHLGALGNRVYFLNPPSAVDNVQDTNFENVKCVDYSGFIRGLRFFPSFLQKLFIKKKFREIEQLCNVKFDIIWSFDNSVFFNFSAISDAVIKISHIVDLNQDFQTRKAAQTADFCFCTTDLIAENLKKYSDNVFKINHGFNVVQLKNPNSIELPGKNGLKAVLIGNLAMQYLDWKVLLECVKNNQEVDFVFYGPNTDVFAEEVNPHHAHKRQLAGFSNTYFPGRVDSVDIPHILEKADVLMVSYQQQFHAEQANPHKIMEYLGSGKAVVATKTMEYRHLADRGLIAMSDNNKQFPDMFKAVVENLEQWNSREKMKARKTFAQENTYQKQLTKIDKVLTQAIKG